MAALALANPRSHASNLHFTKSLNMNGFQKDKAGSTTRFCCVFFCFNCVLMVVFLFCNFSIGFLLFSADFYFLPYEKTFW